MTKLKKQAVEIIRDIPEDKVVIILEILRAFQSQQSKSGKSAETKKATPNNVMGILKKYANPSLIPSEKNAWAEAVGEKYAAY